MFSVGDGGILIDGKMGAFGFHSDVGGVMPLSMEASCQLKSIKHEETREYKKDQFCTPWSPTNTSLKAYQADISDVMVSYDLTYPV